MNRAVFLDRDGVINEAVVRDGKPYPPESLDELRVAADAPESLRALKDAGFLLIVVTNQPDVGRGTQSRDAVEAMNSALGAQLPLDEFVVCYHSGDEACSCRKPKPGMVLDAANRHAIDLTASFLIGDRWRDIDCGQAAGVRTIWIDRGYRERGPSFEPSFRCTNLAGAASWILASGKM